MDHYNSLTRPVKEESEGNPVRRSDLEADKDFDVLSFIESYSDRHEVGHEMKDAEYRKQEERLMDLAIDFVRGEATDENGLIATVNPHPKLSIAHDLVSFLLDRKAATSHLFRRHPIPSSTTPQPFPLNMFMGKWTSWTSFTLSKSKDVQPGTRQCSDESPNRRRAADDDNLGDARFFEILEERGERVIAWRVHGLDTSYYMDRLGYRIPDMVWPLQEVSKHVMRSWLYGVLMINANETLSNSVDLEVHAVATLLHDLGWDTTEASPIISADRRFEVDGAFAARDFIQEHHHGKFWHERSVQLLWDAIALHTERSISYFKELDVQVVSKGIAMDFSGPAYGVSGEEYAAIAKAFPKSDLKDSVNDTIIWLCDTKPQTTYGE
ncbi:hypothetical protein FPRO05_02982 [Fusarium proliferatum]|uniref:HD domain-containing protein n=1 Tax=Gibberella intermedia TaxID=948311 RepID=A0A365N088_GIBIN|nr:hypothetical protein FPRO05_02982 [Fusarium proliferatum]